MSKNTANTEHAIKEPSEESGIEHHEKSGRYDGPITRAEIDYCSKRHGKPLSHRANPDESVTAIRVDGKKHSTNHLKEPP